MAEETKVRTYEPPEEFVRQANVSDPSIYEEAERDFEAFWAEQARELHWFREWDQVLDWNPPEAQWFVGGKTNVSYNCLDTTSSRAGATRPPSSGRATSRATPARSPTQSSRSRSRNSPMCSRASGSKRVIRSRSTCP